MTDLQISRSGRNICLLMAFMAVGLIAGVVATSVEPAARSSLAAEQVATRDQPAATMDAVERFHLPMLGEQAPPFVADTTQGRISFPDDYRGKWVILFSHPADFTPVCTTEFMTFATMQDEFAALNCELIGLSIDSNTSHIAWLRTIRERIEFNGMRNVNVTFPLIADVKMDIARRYGMLHPAASDTRAVRAVFYIDPEARVRALLYYPLSNGRNFDELKRLLVAMQTSDQHGVATPADWRPGDDVIIPPPNSCGQADARVQQAEAEGYICHDWFMCLRPLPLEQVPGQAR